MRIREERANVVHEPCLLLGRRLNSLAGRCEADEKQHDGGDAEGRYRELGTAGRIAGAEGDDEREKAGVGDDSADLGQRHPVGVETGSLKRVVGHHAGERAVRNIDGRIREHQKVVGHPRPDEFPGRR